MPANSVERVYYRHSRARGVSRCRSVPPLWYEKDIVLCTHLGQANLIISFSSVCFQKWMRAGFHCFFYKFIIAIARSVSKDVHHRC